MQSDHEMNESDKPVAALISSRQIRRMLTPNQKAYLRAKGERRVPDYKTRTSYRYWCLLCKGEPYEGLREAMKNHLIKKHGLTRAEASEGLNIRNVKDLRGIVSG